jgi:hypothetical protein
VTSLASRTSGSTRPPRYRRLLQVVIAVVALVALGVAATVVVLPRIADSLARREIARFAGRLPGTVEVQGVALQGSTAVTIQRVSWRDGSDWEAEINGIRVEVDPFGFLVGQRRIERVAVERIAARLGDPEAPLEGPEAAVARLRSLLHRKDAAPAQADAEPGFRASRLPDLAVAQVILAAHVGTRTFRVDRGRVDLAPVKDESVQARRRLVADLSLDEGDGTARHLEIEALLGSGALERVSGRVQPAVVLTIPFGSVSADGVSWAPGEVAVLGPTWSQPDQWTVRAEAVALRWDDGGGPAPKAILDRLPASLAPLAGRFLTGRTVRAVEILRPSVDVVLADLPPVPRRPRETTDGPAPTGARIGPGSPDRIPGNDPRAPIRRPAVKAREPVQQKAAVPPQGAPTAQVRMVHAFQDVAERLSSGTAAIIAAAQAFPEARLEVHGATVRTLEPGQTAARPGQSLVNLEARLERTAGGPIEASLRFECPEAPANANEARLTLNPATGDVKATVKAQYLPMHAFRAIMPRWLRTRDAVLNQTDGTLHFDPTVHRIDASGTLRIAGLVLDLPAVASAPLRLSQASLGGTLAFDWAAGRLDLSGGVASLDKVRMPFEMHAEGLAERPHFSFKGAVERLPAQELVDALPREVLGSLDGMRLSGTFAATVDLDVDTGNLDAVRMDIRPDVADMTTLNLGKAVDMGLLQTVFLHRIEEGDGTIVDRMVGEATPEWVPLTEVPKYLVEALTTSEDANFFQHKGFSTVGIRRSIKVNIERGGFYQGASTLSQQLVKNLFLSREKTMSRKLQEVFLTWQMEQTLPKEKILELYLNVIEWGPNVWGLREAAGHYFAKRPAELSLLEAAYLVTIIPNPRLFHKHVEDGAVPPSFERRVKWLIEEMERRKRIGGDEVAAALEQHIRFAAVQPPAGGDASPGDEPPDEEFGGD